MKNLLLLVFSMLFVQIAIAQSNSTITVFSEYGDKFVLLLNGEQKNEEPSTRVTADNLDQDYYLAVVKFEDESKGVITQKAMRATDLDGNSSHVTYVLTVNKKGDHKIRYYSASPVEAVAEERFVERVYEPEPEPVREVSQERVVVKETVINNEKPKENSNSDNVSIKVDIEGFNMNLDMKVDSSSEVVKTEVITEEYSTETVVSESNTSKTKTSEVEEVVVVNMNDSDYKRLKTSIANQDFSDSKMKVLKQGVNNATLSADQVKGLMELFDFEDDKLEVAKYCYDKCSEPNMYYIVNDAFGFDMSVDELDEYIRTR